MAGKTVYALDTISGRVAIVPAIYLETEGFKDHLVEVPQGTKDYDPEFFKGGSAADHRAKDTSRRKASKIHGKAAAPEEDEAQVAFDFGMTSDD